MHCLIYVSSATASFKHSAGLVELIRAARAHNAEIDVTGLLFYSGGNFLQVLEGEKAVVEQLYASIARDRRHKDVTKLLAFDIPRRQFPDWSMQLRDFGDLPSAERERCGALLTTGRGRRDDPALSEEVRIVLDAFASTMR